MRSTRIRCPATGSLEVRGLVPLAALVLANTIALPAAAAERVVADAVVVNKQSRELLVMRRGTIVRRYRIALGTSPVGAKTQRGDGKTPEGDYVIDSRNARSRFHRALHVSYPGPSDRARAARLGVDPGGEIMIHGVPPWAAALGRAHRLLDWTQGCIAVTNAEIDELWALVPDGTPIRINP